MEMHYSARHDCDNLVTARAVLSLSSYSEAQTPRPMGQPSRLTSYTRMQLYENFMQQ